MEMPSGHIGYGAQDHYCEAEDVDEIIGMLHHTYGMREVVLFATSTGVQIALQVLASGHNVSCITRIIMHGIVCPPTSEYFSPQGIAKRNAHVAKLMKEGRKEDSQAMVGYYDICVTAARVSGGGFLSLQEAL
uniref:Aspartate--tRNA ligase n=1 Tax=Lygus hesperus TaxID=30085 RepID=A0A0A9XI95_LYGHE